MLTRIFVPWLALIAIVGFAIGASLFSEPSHCFQYGKANSADRAAQGKDAASHAGIAGSDRNATASVEHDCQPWWGPHWSLVWATIILCLITGSLAYFTAYLYWTTKRIADEAREAGEKALAASTMATEKLVNVERPYLTGGGGTEVRTRFLPLQDEPSSPMMRVREVRRHLFLVDVANYGKTPALLTHYDVQFETFKNVKTGPMEITKRYKHHDWLAPGTGKRLKELDIPEEKDVVFGGFWYLDFEKQEHCFRFILTIDEVTTHPNIADEVDRSYTHWD